MEKIYKWNPKPNVIFLYNITILFSFYSTTVSVFLFIKLIVYFLFVITHFRFHRTTHSSIHGIRLKVHRSTNNWLQRALWCDLCMFVTYFLADCLSMTNWSLEYNLPMIAWSKETRWMNELIVFFKFSVFQCQRKSLTCLLIMAKFSLANWYCFCTSSAWLNGLFSLNASRIRLSA